MRTCIVAAVGVVVAVTLLAAACSSPPPPPPPPLAETQSPSVMSESVHNQWEAEREAERVEIAAARAAREVAEREHALAPEKQAAGQTTEQKLATLDRLNAASDRVDAAMSDINRKCAPPGSRYAETVAYAKCVARFLVTLCPDIGEGPLIAMSNAARDMDAPVSASLLNQASLDCWNAVYWADTPNGGRTLPVFVGEAVTQMGEKIGEASTRLR